MILLAYGIPSAERESVIAEARAENASGWWDRPLPGVPSEMGTLASYAADANGLTDWAAAVVPGLLQVEEYAMALILSNEMPLDIAELRWLARSRRQKDSRHSRLHGLHQRNRAADTVRRPRKPPEANQALLDARVRGIPVRVLPERLPLGLITHSWLYMTFPHAAPVVSEAFRVTVGDGVQRQL